MKGLLNSPFHFLFSKSVLVLYFKGHKTNKQYSTPLRYAKQGEVIRCFSSNETKWPLNFREPTEVSLQLRGKRDTFVAHLLGADPSARRSILVAYFDEFPQDAAYHDVRRKQGKLNDEDLTKAVTHSRIVEFRPQ